MTTGPSVTVPPAAGDDAVAALEQLVREIDRCAAELQDARTRAEQLLSQRRSGDSWLDIVTEESRPLVVERITTVLGALAGAGSTWRRAQARALQAEHVSINRIAAMFGVTRQRISALLRDQPGPAGRDAGTA
ncbi:hypothetical protein GCM10027261_13460 [Geodermatophilus arenarius]|uniref:Homeodomain-like domain-containing protein n=1 Tax=Geodermatophilus arenarius TaxID=1137990 RepID=A0ABV9LI95_9ACTN